VDVHIKRLREALGEAGSMIETVRGAGYRLSVVGLRAGTVASADSSAT
jgi:two-component system phosphate regulon response regulator PhoB